MATTVEKIKIITADTHNISFAAASYTSTTAFMSGQAVNLAVRNR